MTDENIINYNKCSTCHICNKEILYSDKVRDHCHFTGKFRGPAHNKCDLNLTLKNFKIPVFFHNSKGCDAHLIIQELNKFPEVKFDGIPQNKEKDFILN